MNTSSTTELTTQISRWYESYLEALPGLLTGDLPTLFDYFAVPMLSVSSSGAVTLRNAAEVVNGYVTMFEAAHEAKRRRGVECGHTIRILNARAATISATWEWHDDDGNALAKIPYETLLADSGDGWRIVVITQLDPDLDAAVSPITLQSPSVRLGS
ncbi:DUF6841 family protein [Nocardia pseudobrasiliensis]|uniref:DUF6841 domain-containing protein n=1 Tax=Nocardia pseudobrasiliensis TaxID=45979 RepID=A0A370IBT0_9NOCA|nr:hypothetical protein [Nocardia pseudobrasiliensis]RDI68176.1 hypothetical protein DFR76_102577 [Nocardia pseudobrasiliensis]